ncbi:MAG TPA: AsmA family protein [Terriglobia bacterium]|nr:AsmA family protein [Terriglobia bacterium]
MTSRRKTALVVLVILAVVLIAAMVVVPRLADLDRYRPEVIARLEQSTGRSAAIGRLSLTVLPVLAVRADTIAIGNPPGFPEQPFLEIRRVHADLDLGALLHRRIVIRSLTLEDPVVNLVSNSAGRWNTESPPRPQIRPAAWETSPALAPAISVTRVKLQNGRITACNELPAGGLAPPSFEANGVSAELDDVNAEALGIHLAAADERRMQRARAGLPWTVSIRPAVLIEAGLAVEPAGTAGLARPPGPLGGRGTFSAESVRVNAFRAGRLTSGVELYGGGVMLKGLALELAGGRVTGDLVWDSASQPARYATHLALANLDLARLLNAVPSAGGTITGTLEGRLEVSGWNMPSADPLAGKQGTGNVTVRNGTLPTLQLNKNLMLLMKSVIKTGQASDDPSSFRSIAADLEIGGGEIRSRQVQILGNGVDVDASGALALAGAGRLDYTGVSKINARTTGFTGLIASALGSKMSADGTVNLPFTLTGTLDRPHFGVKNSQFFH